MPNRLLEYSTTTLAAAAESAANTETVIASLGGVTMEYPGQTVRISGWAKITVAAGTTSGLLRIRRTSLTGTSLSETTVENQAFAASKTCESTVFVDDTPGELAGAVYVMTYTGAGEAGAATFLATRLAAAIF